MQGLSAIPLRDIAKTILFNGERFVNMLSSFDYQFRFF